MANLDHSHEFAALGGLQAHAATTLRTGVGVGLFCLIAVAAAAWIVLGLLVAGEGAQRGFGALGPGMVLFGALDLPPAFAAWCATLLSVQPVAFSATLLPALLMWSAMVLAMMLPAAAPLMLTYAEVADTAARRGERVVSLLVLVGGYLSVWFAFAVVAALAQTALAGAGLHDAHGAAPPLVMSVLFLLAGLFQFSRMKQACLARCRRPFTFLFARWSDRPAGVFRLGLEQGAQCLGCCWALMLLMFALGAMNLLAMATLAFVMILERSVRHADAVRVATGLVCLGVGIVLAVDAAGIALV